MKTLSLTAIGLLFCCASVVQAADLFGYNPNNPTTPNPTGFNATGLNNIASRFTVGSSNVTVNFIRYYAGGNGTVSPSISIWSSTTGTLDGFRPDALVAGATGTFTPTQTSTPYTNPYTITFSSPVTLNANTSYYVVVDATQITATAAAGFVAGVAQISNFTAFGTTATPNSRLITQTGSTWANFSSSSFLPYTIGMTSVPEPSTYLLGTIATAAIAYVGRRRKMAAKA